MRREDPTPGRSDDTDRKRDDIKKTNKENKLTDLGKQRINGQNPDAGV